MRRALAALMLIGLLATACGDEGGGGETALEDISLAAEKTQDAGSSAFTMDIQTSGEGIPDGFTITAEGAFDYEGRRGEMTMELPDIAGLGSAGGTTEIVFDGTELYMRSPIFSSVSPGIEWIKIDYATLGEESGIDFEALSQAGGQQDPTQFLQYLEGASDDVEVVGEEEVQGVPTTHYKATIDMEKVLEESPEELRAVLEGALDSLEKQLGTSEFPIEVWIDEDGLARRYRQDLSIPNPSGGGDIEQSMTMELFDFGIDVEVEILRRRSNRLRRTDGRPRRIRRPIEAFFSWRSPVFGLLPEESAVFFATEASWAYDVPGKTRRRWHGRASRSSGCRRDRISIGRMRATISAKRQVPSPSGERHKGCGQCTRGHDDEDGLGHGQLRRDCRRRHGFQKEDLAHDHDDDL